MDYETTTELLRCIRLLKAHVEASTLEFEKDYPDMEHVKNNDMLASDMEKKIFDIANR